jgi:molybdopterin-guanine dinucleotide biosynthesis protein A
LSRAEEALRQEAAAPDAAGFVLAGGRSSRMGRDKALVALGGRLLVEHALGILRDAGLDASIAGARSPLAAFAPVVEDDEADRGPLGGVAAALASTTARRAVFVAVDQPLLPGSLVKYLLHHAQITGRAVTLCSVNGWAQTFPAVIDRAALPALAGELAAGRGGCFSAFAAAAAGMGQRVSVVAVELLAQAGQATDQAALPAVRWFLNVNAAAELRRAEAHGRSLVRAGIA